MDSGATVRVLAGIYDRGHGCPREIGSNASEPINEAFACSCKLE